MATSKKELRDKLDALNIKYKASATVKELEALLPADTTGAGPVGVGSANVDLLEVDTENDSPRKAAFRNHLRQYRRQSPVKYAQKEAGLIARLNTY